MSTVTEKGQATIPLSIREFLGIHPGDEVEFEVEENTVFIHKKVRILPFDKWKGYLGKLQTKEVMDQLR